MAKNIKTQKLTHCALFSALLCICAPIAIPIGPVSVTLSLFAVMLTGIMLCINESIFATVVYILLGTFGLPVFSGAKGGFGIIIGPTGGYIWSYILAVIIIGAICSIKFKSKKTQTAAAFLSCILGTAVCYLCGTLQYSSVTSTQFAKSLSVCVVPFIPFDIIKAVCATAIAAALKSRLKM